MKTYNGACHCRNVRYEVELDLDAPVMECNCSYCAMKGLLLQFTEPEKFRVLQGEEELVTYKFNKHVIDHVFCSDCGAQPFAKGTKPDGTEAIAINVRSIDGIDLSTLNRFHNDGRST